MSGSILDDELSRLIACARRRTDAADTRVPITDRAVEAAWLIARAVPLVGGVRFDGDGDWSRIEYPGGIELDISLHSTGDVDFDFDRGQHPQRYMLSLLATASGGLAYSLYTPSQKAHGVVAVESASGQLAELFRQFTDG